MIEATTPTLTLTLPDEINLENVDELYVTFSQYDKTLTKTLGENVVLISHNIIAVTLTQEETLEFVAARSVSVQVNWIINRARIATSIGYILVTPNLIPEVIVI